MIGPDLESREVVYGTREAFTKHLGVGYAFMMFRGAVT